MKDYRAHYIDGKEVPGVGPTFASVDPFTETEWAEFTAATEEEVDQAVSAAANAFDSWRRTPGIERARLMDALADAIETNLDHLAAIETRDNGKILRENRGQIQFAARNLRFMAGMADKVTGETKPLDKYSTFAFTTREPLGVCALITAWNAPLQLLSNKLPPALATGNTVVIKPSEYTPASTLELARLAIEVGFPPGVINVVAGAGESGSSLVAHPGVAKVSFTGGVETAKRIAALAADNIVPCSLELGGKSAHVIFSDADLDRAVPAAVGGIFAAAGQSCVAGSRLLVQQDIYDQVVEELATRAESIILGNPMDAATQMGPVAHRQHYESVLAHIERARADGARLIAGGGPADPPGGLFVQPTIFADVSNDSHLARNEVFGPILAVMPFMDEEEATALANDTNYGLAGGVWSQDITRALSVAREIRAGIMYVNTYRTSAAQAPSGGFKHSGYGRERGTDAILDYTAPKNTMVDLSRDARDPFVLGR